MRLLLLLVLVSGCTTAIEPGVLVIDVMSGTVTNLPENMARSQVDTSHRLARVIGGKVEAISPEGRRVQIDVEAADAARFRGYRLLSGAELAAEVGAVTPERLGRDDK